MLLRQLYRGERDLHQTCLRLEHAQQTVKNPGLCQHCSAFMAKSLHRPLARQVSLSGKDPCLPSATPGAKEEKV